MIALLDVLPDHPWPQPLPPSPDEVALLLATCLLIAAFAVYYRWRRSR